MQCTPNSNPGLPPGTPRPRPLSRPRRRPPPQDLGEARDAATRRSSRRLAVHAPPPPFVFNAGCSSLLLLDSHRFVFSFLYFFLLRARLRSPLWATRSWSSRRHELMTAPARTWRPRPRMSPRGGYGDTAPPSGGEAAPTLHTLGGRAPKNRMPPCAKRARAPRPPGGAGAQRAGQDYHRQPDS